MSAHPGRNYGLKASNGPVFQDRQVCFRFLFPLGNSLFSSTACAEGSAFLLAPLSVSLIWALLLTVIYILTVLGIHEGSSKVSDW